MCGQCHAKRVEKTALGLVSGSLFWVKTNSKKEGKLVDFIEDCSIHGEAKDVEKLKRVL